MLVEPVFGYQEKLFYFRERISSPEKIAHPISKPVNEQHGERIGNPHTCDSCWTAGIKDSRKKCSENYLKPNSWCKRDKYTNCNPEADSFRGTS